MRMSTREGAAAYFMAAMAVLGAFAGFLLGIGIARGWFGVGGGFGKSLVFTVGSVLALSLLVTGVVWQGARPRRRATLSGGRRAGDG
jgi:high-affinity Fe2+/Pb2+ permease